MPSQEASAENQGTPPSQGPSRSPHVPAPRVHSHCPASRRAWLRKPPAQAHPSTWAPAMPARSTSGTLPQACCSWEDKSAALGGHSRVDPTGLIGPHFAARGRWVFLPFVSPPSSVLLTGAAPVACRSSGAGKRWEGVPADLLSTGIVRQGLLPRHCQGKSPPPNPSWHQGTGQKGGETTLGTPPTPALPARTGSVGNSSILCQAGPTHLKHPPPSTDHPPSSHANPAWHEVKPSEHNSSPVWHRLPHAMDQENHPSLLQGQQRRPRLIPTARTRPRTSAGQHLPSRRGRSVAARARRG